MRNFIARNIGFFIQDIYKNTSIIPTLRYLKKTQNWNKEELEKLQLTKLKALVTHAFNNVPYYQKLFLSIGFHPNDIKSLDDIKRIPVLTKTKAREAGRDLFSQNLQERKLKFGATGGTTGPPFKYIKDTKTRSFVWAAFYRWYEWMGIELGDPVLVLWGAPEVIKTKKKSAFKNKFLLEFENTFYINSFDLNDLSFPQYIKKIKRFRPKLIRGYLSAILQLAHYIENHQIKGINPVAISTTTETLLPPYRKYIEKIFNAPVFDQYGCGECGSIAFECKKHSGLHINMEHVILEVLDSNNHQVLNQDGRIIVTDLDNYAMPFIRYENGDTGSKNIDLCTCGSDQDFIKNLSGRIKDTIILKDEKRVHGVFFTDIFYELNLPETILISRFQVYQITPGEIELRLESLSDIDNKYLDKIELGLNPFFNKVAITVSKKLHNDTSGKFRYIISENEYI